ncbi:hypothetical protein [Chryseobacterium sp. c4a]|nr:hypothetical protein [Chryseobacterium sp. c4a]
MEKAGIKEVDKMQEEIKKEMPTPPKEIVKKMSNYLKIRINSLY